jgi:hypothetical protein
LSSNCAADRDQSGLALLHRDVLALGHAAGFQPGVAGPQGRVAGKRQLSAGREDAHAVVGRGFGGRQHKGGFRQVGPLRKTLHGRVVQAAAVQHHGQRIAEVGLGGEDIDLFEGPVLSLSKGAGFHEGSKK